MNVGHYSYKFKITMKCVIPRQNLKSKYFIILSIQNGFRILNVQPTRPMCRIKCPQCITLNIITNLQNQIFKYIC